MNWLHELKHINPVAIYSQYGEESYLQHIFQNIGTTNKYFVDCGARNGIEWSNTYGFLLSGWKGLMLDAHYENKLVKKEYLTKENINEVLRKYETPAEFDLLNMDVDGVDYWLLDQLINIYSPRVIISEFNSELPVDKALTVKYDPHFEFRATYYYGYSFQAGVKLGLKHGYTIIHQSGDLNLYYLRNDLLPDEVPEVEYKQHKWWGNQDKENRQWEVVK